MARSGKGAFCSRWERECQHHTVKAILLCLASEAPNQAVLLSLCCPTGSGVLDTGGGGSLLPWGGEEVMLSLPFPLFHGSPGRVHIQIP